MPRDDGPERVDKLASEWWDALDDYSREVRLEKYNVPLTAPLDAARARLLAATRALIAEGALQMENDINLGRDIRLLADIATSLLPDRDSGDETDE